MLLEKIFSKYSQLQCVYLFGSQARGEAGPGSDVDLAYLSYVPLSIDEKLNLNVHLRKHFGNDHVQWIDLQESPIFLRFEVLTEGKKIYQNMSDDLLNEYEISTYREYFHTERFRDFQRETLDDFFDSREI